MHRNLLDKHLRQVGAETDLSYRDSAQLWRCAKSVIVTATTGVASGWPGFAAMRSYRGYTVFAKRKNVAEYGIPGIFLVCCFADGVRTCVRNLERTLERTEEAELQIMITGTPQAWRPSPSAFPVPALRVHWQLRTMPGYGI